MRKNAIRFNLTFAAAMILCLAIALPALAQGPGGRFGQRVMAQGVGQADPLTPLKRALQAAGATALTSAQESSITALITNFRAAHVPSTPDTAAQAAHTAFDNSILKMEYNSGAAKIIVDEMAAHTAKRLQDGAEFAISVILIIDKGQLAMVVTKFGTTRTVRLLESLAGGPGMGGGPRQGGVGMGMRRPPAQ